MFIKAVSNYPYGDAFFEMVRFDFVLDSKLNVFLMEAGEYILQIDPEPEIYFLSLRTPRAIEIRKILENTTQTLSLDFFNRKDLVCTHIFCPPFLCTC